MINECIWYMKQLANFDRFYIILCRAASTWFIVVSTIYVGLSERNVISNVIVSAASDDTVKTV